MKVPNDRDFRIHVERLSWSVDVDNPELFDRVYILVLNSRIEIRFVPDVSEIAPPWSYSGLRNDDPIATESNAWLWALLTSEYSATPNPERAGSVDVVSLLPYEPIDGDSNSGVVWFVTPQQWADIEAELIDLLGRTDRYNNFVRLSDVQDMHLGRFLEREFFHSDQLFEHTVKMFRQAH
ncbi:hypothetical protein [Nocardia sp. NPDC020380]|uniref:hypothetical protein n=1 Tax=Nocardia sp. NPDC020380 TaxID=3364309 RepID=UPI003797629B